MLFRIVVVITTLLFPINWLKAQIELLTIKIESHKNLDHKIKILGFYGTETYLIDSTTITEKGPKKITIPTSLVYNGFYRMEINDTLIFDFIYTKSENLILLIDPWNFYNSLKIENGYNNKLLLQLKKEISEINDDISMLQLAFNQNPELGEILNSSIKDRINDRNTLIKSYQNNFNNTTFVSLSNLYIENYGSKNISEYFMNIEWSDSAIIRSNVLPSKIINYFGLNTDLTEQSFKSGIDSILKWSNNNLQNRDYFLYFFLNLFGKVGPEEIFKYLLSNYYFENSCDELITNNEIVKKISKFSQLLPGNKAPNFFAKNQNDKPIQFSDTYKKVNTTYLIFWHPECSFCKEFIPKFYEKIKTQKKINVVSFAIATNKDSWKNSIIKENNRWQEITDLKGWDSDILDLYMVTKTPLIIKINSEGIITQYDIKPSEILNKY